jgi:small subunit ribosomal protein S20
MPIIKSAKKKMRKDKKLTAHNLKLKNNLKGLIKKMRRTPDVKLAGQVASALDKAVKTNLIHANKASRLKSRLSKTLAPAAK